MPVDLLKGPKTSKKVEEPLKPVSSPNQTTNSLLSGLLSLDNAERDNNLKLKMPKKPKKTKAFKTPPIKAPALKTLKTPKAPKILKIHI